MKKRGKVLRDVGPGLLIVEGQQYPFSLEGVWKSDVPLALAGPFVHHFWKDKRAALGGLAPLVFMVIVGFVIRSNMQSAFGGGNNATIYTQQVQEEAMKAVSLGFGAYISGMVSLYFAAVGTKRFLGTRGTETLQMGKSQRAVA